LLLAIDISRARGELELAEAYETVFPSEKPARDLPNSTQSVDDPNTARIALVSKRSREVRFSQGQNYPSRKERTLITLIKEFVSVKHAISNDPSK
jgi:hypothetical protein